MQHTVESVGFYSLRAPAASKQEIFIDNIVVWSLVHYSTCWWCLAQFHAVSLCVVPPLFHLWSSVHTQIPSMPVAVSGTPISSEASPADSSRSFVVFLCLPLPTAHYHGNQCEQSDQYFRSQSSVSHVSVSSPQTQTTVCTLVFFTLSFCS